MNTSLLRGRIFSKGSRKFGIFFHVVRLNAEDKVIFWRKIPDDVFDRGKPLEQGAKVWGSDSPAARGTFSPAGHYGMRFSPGTFPGIFSEDDFASALMKNMKKNCEFPEPLEQIRPPEANWCSCAVSAQGVAGVRSPACCRYAGKDEPVIVNYCDFRGPGITVILKNRSRIPLATEPSSARSSLHRSLPAAEGSWMMKSPRKKFSLRHQNQAGGLRTSSGTYYSGRSSDLKKTVADIEKHPDLKIAGNSNISQLFPINERGCERFSL